MSGEAATGSGLPRPVEAVLALTALLVVSPLLLGAAVAVALSSRGPVLFRQSRVGRHGRPFTLCKFRSMRVPASRSANDGSRPAGRAGDKVTARGDDRITAVGRVLRKTKIDELPELWHVVRGEMSLVGPRPEVPAFVDLDDPLWRRVLAARPGLTDPVTLKLRNEEELLAAVGGDREAFYASTLLPYKLRGYAAYLESRTWRSDVRILWNTFLGIVFPRRTPPPTLAEIQSASSERPSAR